MIYYDNFEFEEESIYELYILRKYLAKHYGLKTSEALIESNWNDLNNLAKVLAKEDIGFFCEYFLSSIFTPSDDNTARTLSPSHYDMWNLLNETFVEDKHEKINIVVSRGFAKTTVCDTALAIWLVCYKKSVFTLLIGKKEDDATSFMDTIKKVFKENEKIIKNFGMLIDKKLKLNATEAEFSNGVYLRAIGSGTSCRGLKYGEHRPSVVIGDDTASQNDVITEQARDHKYDLWCKEVEEVGDKVVWREINGVRKKIKSGTKIVSIGTVLHNSCLISRLMRNNDYHTFLRRAIILEPNQTVEDIFESDLWLQCKKLYFNDKDTNPKETAKKFYEDNKAAMKFQTLWDEKWDCFNDLFVKYLENRISFMSELMNDASSIGEKWFKSIREESSKYIEEQTFTKTLLCIDTASTVSKKSDYTCMVVGSESNNGFTYIRDIVMKKLLFKDYCDAVITMLENNEDVKTIFIEKNVYSGSDVLELKQLINKNPKLKNRRFEFINEMQRRNKDEKISTIIDSVNNGQIIFNKDCEDSKEALQQMKEFMGKDYSIHDDMPDVVSECCIRLKEIKIRTILRVGSMSDLYR